MADSTEPAKGNNRFLDNIYDFREWSAPKMA